MSGLGLTASAGDGKYWEVDLADRLEAESIRRFRQLSELCNVINEAARRAEATLRLENALRLADPLSPMGQLTAIS